MPRFTKGQRAGPGRPPGRRNKLTELIGELAGEGSVRILGVVRERAERGDMRAASIVLSRIWPHRADRAVALDLPPADTPAGLVQAQAALIAAMASGEITPGEASSMANVLETQRRAIETRDHADRLDLLEDRAGRSGKEKSPTLAELVRKPRPDELDP